MEFKNEAKSENIRMGGSAELSEVAILRNPIKAPEKKLEEYEKTNPKQANADSYKNLEEESETRREDELIRMLDFPSLSRGIDGIVEGRKRIAKSGITNEELGRIRCVILNNYYKPLINAISLYLKGKGDDAISDCAINIIGQGLNVARQVLANPSIAPSYYNGECCGLMECLYPFGKDDIYHLEEKLNGTNSSSTTYTF